VRPSARLQRPRIFEGEDITQLPTRDHASRPAIAGRPPRLPQPDRAGNLKMGAFFASNEEIEQGIEYVFGLFPRLKERAASVPAPCPAASSRCWPSAAR
jgi:ABC-type branched-subunit amino acid transport system ATPase component